jgi:hypothetical protein
MRRSGKTTRAVDQAIQRLFTDKKLVLYKGFDKRSGVLDPDAELYDLAQSYFLRILLARLESEHYKTYEIETKSDHIIITC